MQIINQKSNSIVADESSKEVGESKGLKEINQRSRCRAILRVIPVYRLGLLLLA
jgi:hypothetical protein